MGAYMPVPARQPKQKNREAWITAHTGSTTKASAQDAITHFILT